MHKINEPDDVVLPDDHQCVGLVTKLYYDGPTKYDKIIAAQVVASEGEDKKVPLSPAHAEFLQALQVGKYVILETVEAKYNKKNAQMFIIRMLELNTITRMVEIGMWPQDFEPYYLPMKFKKKDWPYWKLNYDKDVYKTEEREKIRKNPGPAAIRAKIYTGTSGLSDEESDEKICFKGDSEILNLSASSSYSEVYPGEPENWPDSKAPRGRAGKNEGQLGRTEPDYFTDECIDWDFNLQRPH